jgi:hypothetical protein
MGRAALVEVAHKSSGAGRPVLPRTSERIDQDMLLERASVKRYNVESKIRGSGEDGIAQPENIETDLRRIRDCAEAFRGLL